MIRKRRDSLSVPPSIARAFSVFRLRETIRWFALLTTLAISGCSHTGATVSGTVVANGKPVTGGNIVFSPAGGNRSTAPGKPGAAEIRPDGSFVLTLEPGEKGLAERFTVRFTPPVLPPMSEAEAKVTLPPYQGFVPKQPDVAVRSGANTLDIELVKAVKR
jgi:hypothetical protein